MSEVRSNRQRHRGVIRLEALWRLALLRTLARVNGSLLVTEFPKSGGTWLAGMVADLSGRPFPQNALPGVGPSVFHGHYLGAAAGLSTVVLWRDPRDVVVSWYHHCLLSEHTNPVLVRRTRDDLGFSDDAAVATNLPEFIDYMFTRQRAPGFSWNAFFDAWARRDAGLVHTSYERLSDDASAELARLTRALGIDPVVPVDPVVAAHSFERRSGRAPGQQDHKSFLRKGVVGDWRNVFSDRASELLAARTEGRLDAYADFVRSLP